MKKLYLLLIAMMVSLGLFAQDQQNVAYFSFNGLNESPNVQNVIPADGGVLQATATLYLDGTNGSSAWESSELGRFTGTNTNLLTGFDKGFDLGLQGASSNGKTAVFKFSTSGYQDIVMTFAFKRTAQGHNQCTWSYSTDGTSFTALPVPADQPYTGGIDYRTETLDLSGIDALDNQATVYLRLFVDGCQNDNSRIRIDNVQINAYPGGPDVYAPRVTNALVIDSNKVELVFNEELDNTSAETVANYTFDNGSVASVASLSGAGTMVTVTVAPAFPNGVPFNMFVAGVTDVAGNVMEPDTLELTYGIAEEFLCADIATLRSKLSWANSSVNAADTIEYKLTGNVIVTAVAEYRNQKILQDATGAILVFDIDNKLGTNAASGDVEFGDELKGIYCTLTNYFGFLELVPTRPYEEKVDVYQEVTPTVVTLAQLNDNDYMSEHQAELMTLEDVTITSSGNFAVLNRYDLSQNGVTGPALFPYFQDVNYLGMAIPTGVAQNITGFNFATAKIGGNYYDFRYYIVPRFQTDMTGMSQLPDYGKMRVSVYPNPTTDFVTVNDVEATDVEIYDINGKKVASQSMQNSNMVSMHSLSAGSYFLRLLKDNELVGTAKVIKK